MPDSHTVNNLFGRIAPRYDLANRVLSGGIDVLWRDALVRHVARTRPGRILDLATGSGDVALALARGLPAAEIVGTDFCQPMLDQAAGKLGERPAAQGRVRFEWADALQLPYPDESCDAVTMSFGLRNTASRAACLAEMRRVLRPGRSTFVLEFSQPARWLRPLYYFYIRKILPGLAGVLTGDRAAYVYLNETISAFPDRAALAREFLDAGFSTVAAFPLTGGIAALHVARK